MFQEYTHQKSNNMDLELLNKAMRAEARSLGLCDKWFGEWADDTGIDELLNKYTKGIDFVIDKGFPDDDTLLKYAGKDNLRNHGIYINDYLDVCDADVPTLVINGSCTGDITYTGYHVANIYVRGKSDVTIKVKDSAKVFVEVYDDAKVLVRNYGDSLCFAYRYGGTVDSHGNVLVREKKKPPTLKQ